MHNTNTESSAVKTAAPHVIGLMALAMANPLVHHTNNPVYQWSLAFATPLLLAGFVYLIYAVFRREKAKDGWPKSFFLLAWVLSALLNFLPWAERKQPAAAPSPAIQTQAQLTPPETTPPIEDGNEKSWGIDWSSVPKAKGQVAAIHGAGSAHLKHLVDPTVLDNAVFVVEGWQALIEKNTGMSADTALKSAYGIVSSSIEAGDGLCFPDTARDGGVALLENDQLLVSKKCRPL